MKTLPHSTFPRLTKMVIDRRQTIIFSVESEATNTMVLTGANGIGKTALIKTVYELCRNPEALTQGVQLSTNVNYVEAEFYFDSNKRIIVQFIKSQQNIFEVQLCLLNVMQGCRGDTVLWENRQDVSPFSVLKQSFVLIN